MRLNELDIYDRGYAKGLARKIAGESRARSINQDMIDALLFALEKSESGRYHFVDDLIKNKEAYKGKVLGIIQILIDNSLVHYDEEGRIGLLRDGAFYLSGRGFNVNLGEGTGCASVNHISNLQH